MQVLFIRPNCMQLPLVSFSHHIMPHRKITTIVKHPCMCVCVCGCVRARAPQAQIYGPHSQEPQRSVTRFKSTAYGGSFRGDGHLLVTGSEEGLIRLFDVGGRVALRQYSGHNKYVCVCVCVSVCVYVFVYFGVF